MSMFTRNLKQTIVYWGTPVADGYGGYTFNTPIEIKGRWEDSQQVFVDSSGVQSISKAVIYVDRDVSIESYLYLGDLDDIASSDESNPKNVSGAYMIKSFNKIPNIKTTDYERKVFV